MIYAHLHEHECLYPKGEPWDSAMHIHDTEVKGVGDFHTHDDPHEHGEPWILSDNFGYPQQKYPDWKTPPLHPEPESRFGTLYLPSDWEVPERKQSFWKELLSGWNTATFSQKDTAALWGFGAVLFLSGWIIQWVTQSEWGFWLRSVSLGIFISTIWLNVLFHRRSK